MLPDQLFRLYHIRYIQSFDPFYCGVNEKGTGRRLTVWRDFHHGYVTLLHIFNEFFPAVLFLLIADQIHTDNDGCQQQNKENVHGKSTVFVILGIHSFPPKA